MRDWIATSVANRLSSIGTCGLAQALPVLVRYGRPLRQWLGGALVVAAFAAVGHLVVEHRAELALAIRTVDLRSVLAAGVVAAFSILCNAAYFERLVTGVRGERTFSLRVVSVFVVSQIVRYLPGRVWGMVYQGALLRGVLPMKSTGIVTVIQALMTGFTTVGYAGSIFLLLSGKAFEAALLCGLTILASHLLHSSTGWVRNLTRTLPGNLVSNGAAIRLGTVLLALDWVFRIALWSLLLPDGTELRVAAGFAAAYALASFVSSVASVVPGGLALREGLFVLFGGLVGFDEQLLLAQGILVRLVLTAAELLLGVMFYRMSRDS